MRGIIGKVIGNSLIKDSAKLASSNILLYLLPFAVTPILTRLYAPSYFGEWGVFSSTYQIINCILFLCYDYAIIKSTEEEYPSVCGLSFIVSISIIFLTTFIFGCGKYFGVEYFTEFPGFLNLLLLLVFSSVSHILQILANRNERYWVMSSASFVLGVTQAICRILFGIWVCFPNGLIAGTTVAQAINIVFLLLFVGAILTGNFWKSISVKRIRNVAYKYRNFPLYDAPATLLLFATFNLSLLVLSEFYTKSEIGSLSVIHQMLLLPMSLVGTAMGRVYYKQISDLDVDHNRDEIAKKSSQMLRIILLISVIPTLFLTLGGDHLVNIFLGKKWTNAGHIAICLTLWSIPNILTQPLLPIFRKTDKQRLMLWFNVANFVLGVGALLITCNLNCSIYTSLLVYSIGSALANYAMFVSIIKYTKVSISQCFNPIVVLLQIFAIISVVTRFIFI